MRHRLTILLGATAAALSAMDAGPVEIHGFASQGYLITQDNDYLVPHSRRGSWDFNEVGLNFSTQATDKLRIGAQIYARDLGQFGNYQPELDWAYGDYRLVDELGVRVGRFKVPLGFYNETSDYDSTRTSVFLPQSIYDIRLRDFYSGINGVQAYGRLSLNSAGALNYQICGGNTNYSDDGSVAYYFNSGLSDGAGMPVTTTDISSSSIAAANLQWEVPLDGMRIGYSVVHVRNLKGTAVATAMNPPMGFNPFPTNSYIPLGEYKVPIWNQWVASLEYVLGDWTFASEYGRGHIGGSRFIGQTVPDIKSENWYLQTSYRFFEVWEGGVYYSNSVSATDEYEKSKSPDDYLRDLAFSLRYDVNDNFILKGEAHVVRGTQGGSVSTGSSAGLDPEWAYYAAKASFSF